MPASSIAWHPATTSSADPEASERLTRAAALGTMVGGVAHEVRNPLHAIAGFAELLEREATPGSRPAKHAARIRAGVRDLEALVDSLQGGEEAVLDDDVTLLLLTGKATPVEAD